MKTSIKEFIQWVVFTSTSPLYLWGTSLPLRAFVLPHVNIHISYWVADFRPTKGSAFFQRVTWGIHCYRKLWRRKYKWPQKRARQIKRTGPAAVWLLPSAQEIPVTALGWDWTREASPSAFATRLVFRHPRLGFLRTRQQV